MPIELKIVTKHATYAAAGSLEKQPVLGQNQSIFDSSQLNLEMLQIS